MELDRLDKVPQPSRRDIERSVTSAEQNCTGEEKCLTAIGKRLGVEYVVTGTVGSLGDNYVLNIKVVDVATGKSQRIQSDPLRGSPDELIEGVRVAAYRLLAPQQIHGSLQIQSDLIGAEVTLDGKPLGKTPLPNGGVVAKLPLGKHQLRVEAKSYDAVRQRRRGALPEGEPRRRPPAPGERTDRHRQGDPAGALADLHEAVVHRRGRRRRRSRSRS